MKGFHLFDSASVPGWLLLIDPNDLAIDEQQQADVSSARLTIQQFSDGRTYLYHVNAVESLRYKITNTGFELDNDWTRSYRIANSPSTRASSPLLFGDIGQVVFADNTAPELRHPYSFTPSLWTLRCYQTA